MIFILYLEQADEDRRKQMISHRIQKLNSDGELFTKWGSEGNGNGKFRAIAGVDVDSTGNVYVS